MMAAEPQPAKRKTSTKSAAAAAKSSSSLPRKTEREQFTDAKPFFKSSVVWTTPLRMPVVQPYRTSTSRGIATTLQKIHIQEPQVWEPVSKRKQLQAFPPNFIHSLDATHMLLSALRCSERGVTFASVHDSFWTHAADVDVMSEVLRDQFIAMHGEDVIGRLREEFVTRYAGCMQLASVPVTSALGKRIMAVRKRGAGKKLTSAQELKVEQERLELLASEDPEKRAAGEAMVTPGSLLMAARGEEDAVSPVEMSGQTLGAMPDGAAVEAEAAAVNGEGILDEVAAGPDADELEAEVMEAVDATAGEAATTDASVLKKQATKASTRKLHVWVPLEFPPVPKKGDFDVRRLRDSKYFFS